MNNQIVEWLKETNLTRNNNYYFLASNMKIPEEYILYKPFIVSENEEDFYTYVINYTEEGLGVLPLLNGIKSELATFVPLAKITKVTRKKGLFYNKVYIIIDNNKILSIRINKKDTYLKEQGSNSEKFLSDFVK